MGGPRWPGAPAQTWAIEALCRYWGIAPFSGRTESARGLETSNPLFTVESEAGIEGFSSMTTTTCPICGSEAEEVPRTGDFDGFDCPTHDKFEVANTAMSIRPGKASADHWERSLERAKLRAGRGKPPRILDNDFL
jgi:hypothetical protein